MFKPLKNIFVLLSLLIVSIGYGYFIFCEDIESIRVLSVVLIFIAAAPFLLSKIGIGLEALILFAPLSIDVVLSSGLKLSFPTEVLTIALTLLFVMKWLAGLTLNYNLLKHPLFIILALDLVWALISATQSELSEFAVKRVALKLLYLMVYFVLFGNFFDNIRSQKKIFFLYGVGFIIPILHTLNSHARYNFEQPYSPAVSQPFYSDHTVYGACLAFIIPFFIIHTFRNNRISKMWKSALIIFSVLLMIAVVFSYSRASWISLFAAAGLYLLIHFRVSFNKFLSIVIMGVIFVSLNFQKIYTNAASTSTKYNDDVTVHLSSVTNLKSDESNLERVNRWVCAYRMFRDKPIFGFGPGTYQFFYDQYQTAEFMTRISTHKGDRGNAHSEYLMALSETGVVGGLIFVCIVMFSIRIGFRVIYASNDSEERMLAIAALLGLTTFYVHGLFNTFSDIDKMAILFLGSLSMLVNIDLSQKNASRIEEKND